MKKALLTIFITLLMISGILIVTGLVWVRLHKHSLSPFPAEAATCTDDGNIKYYYCKYCIFGSTRYFSDKNAANGIKYEDTIIPALGHNVVFMDSDASCTAEGVTEHYYCNRCKKKFEDKDCTKPLDKNIDTTIKKTLHNYGDDDICIDCQKPKDYATDLYFEYTNNDTAYQVLGIGEHNAAELHIPAEYNGLPVVSIADYAFYESEVIDVTIPVSVETIGEGAFRDSQKLERVVFKKNSKLNEIKLSAFQNCVSLKSIAIPEGSEKIGANAFKDCSALKSITVPANVELSTGVFDNCIIEEAAISADHINSIQNRAYLKTVVILGGVDIPREAFSGCTALTSITIPETVESIKDYAFYGCTSLSSVVIPGSVASIGAAAFKDCESLAAITLPEKVTSISQSTFENCKKLESVSISTGLASIGESAFKGCETLTSIPLTDKVASIAKSTYEGCIALTSVSIPASITEIGDNAFAGCTALTSITVNESVKSIGTGAFSGCSIVTANISTEHLAAITDRSALKTVTLSAGESLADNAFANCTSLESVTVGSTVTSISTAAFADCKGITSISVAEENTAYKSIDGNLYSKDGKTFVKYAVGKSATEFTILNDVITIADNAFASCSNLTDITIPGTVEQIGTGAFSDCSIVTANISTEHLAAIIDRAELKTVTLSAGESLADNAFANCTSLKSVTVGSTVTSISTEAFTGCTLLDTISVAAENTAYKSIDGNLYSKDGKTLVKYAVGKLATEFTVLDDVTAITDNAFRGCSALTSVTFSDAINSIGVNAFENCSALKSIAIPNTVDHIGEGAFAKCFITYAEISADNLSAITNKSRLETVIFTAGKTIKENALDGCGNLKSVSICNSIETIEAAAFKDTGLTSVTVPADVTSIGAFAFNNCTSLVSITLSDKITAISASTFEGCTALESVSIPDAVTTIGDSAFAGCTALASVAYGDDTSIQTIGAKAFMNCASLANVIICNGVTAIGADAYTGCLVENATLPTGYISYIPKAVLSTVIFTKGTVIEEDAFNGCTSLTSVTIFDAVEEIKASAFKGCSALTVVTIPNKVTTIGDFAFAGCTALTSVVYGDDTSIQTIGAKAFENCSNLENITIPNSVVTVAVDAYSGSPIKNAALSAEHIGSIPKEKLEEVTVTAGATIYEKALENCATLKKITLSDSVISISKSAFRGCTKLNTVNFGAGVESIGDQAFFNCESLKTIVLPESLTTIGSLTFSECTALTSITIPANVTSIGQYAFWGCPSLTSITFADTSTWYKTSDLSDWNDKISGTELDVSSATKNVELFTSLDESYNTYWYKL